MSDKDVQAQGPLTPIEGVLEPVSRCVMSGGSAADFWMGVCSRSG